MSLSPTPTDLLSRARSDMRMGLPVVLDSGAMQCLAVPAETVDAALLGSLQALGHPMDLVITARRAETLRAPAYDGDVARIMLPPDADPGWIRSLADPAHDLSAPLKGPLRTLRDGNASLHRLAVRVVKSARLLPAALVMILPGTATFPDLTRLEAEPSARLLSHSASLTLVTSAALPLSVAKDARLHVFRPEDGQEEHYAIEIGSPRRDTPVLSRLHSACFTGDLMGSLKCDCGPQLRAAMAQMGAEGTGVLLYLNQEGRGIGLANKMRAYSLQDQGFDTVEANHRLGFEDDERDFQLGSGILKTLGFTQVRLLTNNPAKIAMMEQTGISVIERVPLRVGETDQNRDYLATKAKKSGHLL